MFNVEKLDEEHQDELNAFQKQPSRTGPEWSIEDYFCWFRNESDGISGREFFDHWYKLGDPFPTRSVSPGPARSAISAQSSTLDEGPG